MGARDALATITDRKLDDRNGYGLTACREYVHTASVVMLSNDTPNSSIRQFMKYISNFHILRSNLQQ